MEVEGKRLQKIPVSKKAVADRPHLIIKPGLNLSTFIPATLADRAPAMEYLDIALASLEEQSE